MSGKFDAEEACLACTTIGLKFRLSKNCLKLEQLLSGQGKEGFPYSSGFFTISTMEWSFQQLRN
jgi:hypothetical protein